MLCFPIVGLHRDKVSVVTESTAVLSLLLSQPESQVKLKIDNQRLKINQG